MTSLPFPKGFLWGAATSAYQVEGGNQWSDWAEWEKRTGRERCGGAVEHYQRFADDFELARDLGHNAHRLGIEWARLEPQEDAWNEEALAHYEEALAKLKALGLAVCLTLQHFTLPQWLAREGGWESGRAVERYVRMTERVVRRLGKYVDLWITVNEPLVAATESYLYGHWPPQVRSMSRTKRVLTTLAQAHREAYDVIHRLAPGARVGVAHNAFSFAPLRSWLPTDRWAARSADRFWNDAFFGLTQGRHDFLGLNYYFHQRAKFCLNLRRGGVCFADPRKLGLEVSALGWEVYPAGLREVLLRFARAYRLPVYVTENGIAPQNEEQRTSFLVRSLGEVHSAVASGADVRGYFYWSLLDNFEWDKGFGPAFGLVEVERKTMRRMPRPAAYEFKRIAQANAL